MKSAIYEVRGSEFHNSYLISTHKSLNAAIRSMRKNDCGKTGCTCGGPRIVRNIEGPLTQEEWRFCSRENLNFSGKNTGRAFAEPCAYLNYGDYMEDYKLVHAEN